MLGEFNAPKVPRFFIKAIDCLSANCYFYFIPSILKSYLIIFPLPCPFTALKLHICTLHKPTSLLLPYLHGLILVSKVKSDNTLIVHHFPYKLGCTSRTSVGSLEIDLFPQAKPFNTTISPSQRIQKAKILSILVVNFENLNVLTVIWDFFSAQTLKFVRSKRPWNLIWAYHVGKKVRK